MNHHSVKAVHPRFAAPAAPDDYLRQAEPDDSLRQAQLERRTTTAGMAAWHGGWLAGPIMPSFTSWYAGRGEALPDSQQLAAGADHPFAQSDGTGRRGRRRRRGGGLTADG